MIGNVLLSCPAPTGLAAPSVRYTSGSSAVVTWSPPTQANGLIRGYRIKFFSVPTFADGYSDSTPSPSSPERIITNTSSVVSVVVNDLLPSRRYEIRVNAFTSGGEVDSTGTVIFTNEAGQ